MRAPLEARLIDLPYEGSWQVSHFFTFNGQQCLNSTMPYVNNALLSLTQFFFTSDWGQKALLGCNKPWPQWHSSPVKHTRNYQFQSHRTDPSCTAQWCWHQLPGTLSNFLGLGNILVAIKSTSFNTSRRLVNWKTLQKSNFYVVLLVVML